VNALVYELFLPDKLHDAGLHFFEISSKLHLRPLAEMESDRWVDLRALFEEVYGTGHPLRQDLFSLDSIEEIRIIEGKA
jgi:hypothetical protein